MSDQVLVKKAHKQLQYSLEQLLEIKKCKDDPVYFIENYVRLRHPTKGAMSFNMFDYQHDMVRAYVENRNIVVMLPRQAGKSQTAAAFLLWWTIFIPDQYVLVASNLQAGADDIMARFWFAYEELPEWLKPGVIKNDARTKAFDNGSKFVTTATTKDSGRGRSVSLLYVDELAFVKPSIADEFWASIKPTLSTGGKCIITSTPNDDENLFARIWFSAKPLPYSYEWDGDAKDEDEEPDVVEDYETVFETQDAKLLYETEVRDVVKTGKDDGDELTFRSYYAPWTVVPDKIDDEGNPITYRGEEYKIHMLTDGGFDEERFAREYECRFTSSGNTLISGITLGRLDRNIRKPQFVDKHGVRWFRPFNEDDTAVIVSMDPSGDGVGDFSVIQVLTLPRLEQVAEWSSKMANQVEQAEVLYRTLYRIDAMLRQLGTRDSVEIYYSVERNGLGVGVIQALNKSDVEDTGAYMVDSTIRSLNKYGEKLDSRPSLNVHRGLITTNASKVRYALEMKQLIETGLLTIRSRNLVSELKTFIRIGNTFKAESGKHDDHVMSMVLAMQLLDEVRGIDPEIDDMLSPELTLDDDGADAEVLMPAVG